MQWNVTQVVGHSKAVAFEPEARLDQVRRQARWTAGVLLVLAVLLGGVMRVTGAVVAFGTVTVDSKVKKITHPTGGVIAHLGVKDGDHVRAGQVLLRFDTAVSGVNAETSGDTLYQLLARQARLIAERDGASDIHFPAELANDQIAAAKTAIAQENSLFRLRRLDREGQRVQLRERIAQLRQEVSSDRQQAAASRQQAVVIGPELQGIHELYAKGLSPISRVNELERTAIALKSNAASLDAQAAQSGSKISETSQQMAQIDQDARSQAGNELADVNVRIADQRVRKATASDTLDRSEIRAPQSGVVTKLAFSAQGNVVMPGQEIMEIVPDKDRLTIEARVNPTDVDKAALGQEAELRFTAFDAKTTPQIAGTVRYISADRQIDERTGASYYVATIEISKAQIDALKGHTLMQGMPVEVYLKTGSRSMLSYIVKPLIDQFSRSFRQH